MLATSISLRFLRGIHVFRAFFPKMILFARSRRFCSLWQLCSSSPKNTSLQYINTGSIIAVGYTRAEKCAHSLDTKDYCGCIRSYHICCMCQWNKGILNIYFIYMIHIHCMGCKKIYIFSSTRLSVNRRLLIWFSTHFCHLLNKLNLMCLYNCRK